jgi:hypothetical protein
MDKRQLFAEVFEDDTDFDLEDAECVVGDDRRQFHTWGAWKKTGYCLTATKAPIQERLCTVCNFAQSEAVELCLK